MATSNGHDGPRRDPPPASPRDAVELADHLATLARSGLPLPRGLRAAGEEVDAGPLRSIMIETAGRLEAGEPLDRALAIEGGRFPARLRALVEAGARSGKLADVLAEFVRHANLGEELRRGAWAAVAYPLVLLAILSGVLGLASRLAVQVVGSLVNASMDFGVGVAPGNLVVLRIARWISDWGPTALLVAVGLAALGWLWARFTQPPAWRRRFVMGLPLIGPVLRFSALAEFCHLLGLLVEAEVPLPEALEMAGAGVRDADLAEHCTRMAGLVGAGQPLSEAVETWPAIPAGLGQVFRWSEGRQALPDSLHLAGELFEARARAQAKFANGVLIAILLLLIANGIGFALLLLIQPIMLLTRLSGGFTPFFTFWPW